MFRKTPVRLGKKPSSCENGRVLVNAHQKNDVNTTGKGKKNVIKT